MEDTHKNPKWKYSPELQIEGIHSHLVVMVYIRSEERALILEKVIYHASNRLGFFHRILVLLKLTTSICVT